MGSYRSDDEALIALARQLTDAYGEARRREDQDYACDSIAEYLAEFRESAPSEALLAILDLPLTAETYPLVDEVQGVLASRGPAVVELLLEALLGEVYDPDGPAPERAAETLDQMDPGEASLGLTEVLCGRADDQVKGAAVDGLVALGGIAEPDLVATLDDPEGGDWARAALEQIRFEREHAGARDEEPDAGDDEAFDDGDDSAWEPDDRVAAGEATSDELTVGGSSEAPTDASTNASAYLGESTLEPGPAAGPDLDTVDDAYEEFLERFEQDSDDEPSSP
jgi:hypothetical protein